MGGKKEASLGLSKGKGRGDKRAKTAGGTVWYLQGKKSAGQRDPASFDGRVNEEPCVSRKEREKKGRKGKREREKESPPSGMPLRQGGGDISKSRNRLY